MDAGSFSAFASELATITFEKRARRRTFKDLFEPQKAKVRKRIDYHFSDNAPDKWRKFVRNVESPEFVRQLAKHPKSDHKLVTHAQSMHELVTGKTMGKVQSSTSPGKTYEIKKVPGGLGCSCPDWRFVSSVKPRHECKHIKAHRQGKVRPD